MRAPLPRTRAWAQGFWRAACGAALAGLVAAAPAHAQAAGSAPADLVDPIIGTTGYGNTFPGAAVPFGMVQLSPDTRGGPLPASSRPGGYDWSDSEVRGFSHTHLSGAGCNSYGHVPFMPTVGPIQTTPEAYASPFSHDGEVARPGLYGVDLDRYGIRAELSSSARAGAHRYTFPSTSEANVLIDLGKSLNPVTDADVDVVDPNTIEGSSSSLAFCDGGGPVTVYFSAKFNRPFQESGVWDGSAVKPGTASARGSGIGAFASFDTSTDRVVEAQVGISFVSVEGARANRVAEVDGLPFDGIRQRAADGWNDFLSSASVEGGSSTQQRKFYTALYHAGLHPNVFSDQDGSFRGMDGRIHSSEGYVRYANFSLWDSYRTQHQLLTLVAPARARDMTRSLLAQGREGGWPSRWTLANVETNIQSGDSISALVADAHRKRLIDDPEAGAAFPGLLANATRSPPAGSGSVGRVGVSDYTAHGYAPFALSPHHARSGASATLEYALADCGLSGMAARLGRSADAETLFARAGSYQRLFDRSTGFFRPRLPNGSFRSPFDPTFISAPYLPASSAGYEEGSAWQYLWLVPQDPRGLVRLLGGRAATAGQLDRFFALDELTLDPAQAKSLWRGGTRYAPDNEPDLHAPFLYAYAGQPWKTQDVVRAELDHVYSPGADGIFGNDDLGTLSSWYVLSSLGLYPVSPGADFYALTTPAFVRATVRLQTPFYSGQPLIIEAPGVSAANRYMSSLTVDGAVSNRAWISHDAIRSGPTLRYAVGTTPNKSFAATPGDTPPSPCAQGELRASATSVPTGQAVAFDASSSSTSAGAHRYDWDLDGNGSFEQTGSSAARVSRRYSRPGRYRVRVRDSDSEGVRRAFQDITVTPGPASRPAEAKPRIDARSLLRRAERAVRRAGVRGLLRGRGFRFSAGVAAAGRLRVRLVARRRPVTLAFATKRLARPGKGTVRVRLTPRGRRRLKGTRGRLAARLELRYLADDGRREQATRRLSLKR